jgi:hypothetical protein
MYISPTNPVVKKVLNDFMAKELFTSVETAYDTDNVVYRVYGDEEKKQFKFCFSSNCSAYILENGGMKMLEAKYKEFLRPKSEWDPDFDLTLFIDLNEMPKTKKVKKSMEEAEAEAIRQENDLIRIKRKDLIEPIAERLSELKKDFLSAPIRMAMEAGLAGKNVPPMEVSYRQDEKYWVTMPVNGEIQVSLAVNFHNDVDVSLGRVMLLEWQDSQRKVKTPPMIKFHDKELPAELAKAFPKLASEKYSNGLISFSKLRALIL